MLISKYIDKPKVIGPVGVILGENGINIAGMQVGREKIGGEAVMVLNVDDRVDEEIMEEVRRVDGIIDVKLVTL
jgi:D-3-phosphoglycerate dehydrogenase